MCVCVQMCVCVWVYALRENVNVVMNPERTLVIGAIDRNHLMHMMIIYDPDGTLCQSAEQYVERMVSASTLPQ